MRKYLPTLAFLGSLVLLGLVLWSVSSTSAQIAVIKRLPEGFRQQPAAKLIEDECISDLSNQLYQSFVLIRSFHRDHTYIEGHQDYYQKALGPSELQALNGSAQELRLWESRQRERYKEVLQKYNQCVEKLCSELRVSSKQFVASDATLEFID